MMHKRLCTVLLACTFIFSGAVIPAGAVEVESCASSEIVSRVTSQINHTIQANSIVALKGWVSLDKGELIQFNCTYVSKSASVDFGFVDPDGAFYYVNCTSGSIYKSLKITKAGEYRIAIRNNASYDITVTGSIRY